MTMGFILFLLVIAVSVVALVNYYEVRKETVRETAVICLAIGTVLTGFFMFVSYTNYVGMVQRKATHIAYMGALNSYTEKATPSMNSSQEITDFKYQNYQTEMARLTRDARYNAIKYNETLAGKLTLKASWLFGWLVVPPDDNAKPLTIK